MSDCSSGRGWSPIQEELKAQAQSAEEVQTSTTSEVPVDPQGNQGQEQSEQLVEQTVTEVANVAQVVDIQEQVEKTNTIPLDGLPDGDLVQLAVKHGVSVENKTREAVQQELTALGITNVSA